MSLPRLEWPFATLNIQHPSLEPNRQTPALTPPAAGPSWPPVRICPSPRFDDRRTSAVVACHQMSTGVGPADGVPQVSIQNTSAALNTAPTGCMLLLAANVPLF